MLNRLVVLISAGLILSCGATSAVHTANAVVPEDRGFITGANGGPVTPRRVPIQVIADNSIDSAVLLEVLHHLERVSRSPNLFVYAGRRTVERYATGELAPVRGAIVIQTGALRYPTIGETLTRYSRATGAIFASTITISTAVTSDPLKYKLVLMHEVMHALGLEHDLASESLRSIMEPYYRPNGRVTAGDATRIRGIVREATRHAGDLMDFGELVTVRQICH